MKKIMLLTAILFALTTIATAQNDELRKWANKTGGTSINVTNNGEKAQASNPWSDYAQKMQKSARLQYGALTCATVGAGLSIAGALVGTKSYYDDPEHPTLEEQQTSPKKAESDRKLRRGLFVGAAACFAGAVILEWASIECKVNANHTLKVFATESGGGLAYIF